MRLKDRKTGVEMDVSFGEKIRALGSVVRIGILKILSERPLPVIEIAKKVGLSQPSCSNHINILWRAGFLTRKKKGRYTIYGLNTSALENYFSTAQRYLGLDSQAS